MADMFRVDPARLTAVREAYEKALDELAIQLDELGQVGHVNTPWLGDDVSEAVRVHYNGAVMESPLGAFQAMRKYEAELRAVRDQFAEMERAYLAGEGTNVGRARQVRA